MWVNKKKYWFYTVVIYVMQFKLFVELKFMTIIVHKVGGSKELESSEFYIFFWEVEYYMTLCKSKMYGIICSHH